MPRVSIYCTDELKARMDAVGDKVNWSEIVRPSILAAIATQEHRKTDTMASAIERLKASKAKWIKENKTDLEDAGRKWAADKAEYGQLLAIHRWLWLEENSEADGGADNASDALYQIIHLTDEAGATADIRKVAKAIGLPCEDFNVSVEQAAAFMRGAHEFFQEIGSELDEPSPPTLRAV